MNALLKIADIGFFVFHIALIFFNLFGWWFRSTRRWNLVTLGLTALSWFGLGIFYGWGYCFVTDWHWQVRRELGYAVTSNSYIHFLVTTLTPIKVSENTVDIVTGVAFAVAVVVSILVNFYFSRKSGAVSRVNN
jgi:hypothetical protein